MGDLSSCQGLPEARPVAWTSAAPVVKIGKGPSENVDGLSHLPHVTPNLPP